MRTKFSDEQAYFDWVEQAAKHNIARDGSDWDYVAEVLITSVEVLGDGEFTLTYNAEPYAPSRAPPTAILRERVQESRLNDVPCGYRDLAVEVLARDLVDAGDAISRPHHKRLERPDVEVGDIQTTYEQLRTLEDNGLTVHSEAGDPFDVIGVTLSDVTIEHEGEAPKTIAISELHGLDVQDQ
jgi:hypothetical protein